MTKTSKSTAMIRRRKNKSSPEFPNKARKRPNRTDDHNAREFSEADCFFHREVLGSSVIQKIMSSDKTIFLGLLVIRIVNAMLMQTFFVPDEFWQSVEVAHKMVFKYGYLTWEWKVGIRSYAYPLLFATLYKVLQVLRLDYRLLLIRGPRLLQGMLASLGDLYMFFLSRRLAGRDIAQWTLLCQLLSWFIGYCCTRTLSNSMESVLVTAALYYFPWPGYTQPAGYTRRFIVVAACSVVVRPTAAVIWVLLFSWHLQQCKGATLWSTLQLYIMAGLTVIGISTLVDYMCYGHWLLVHLNFLHFNVLSGGSGFYGRHSWHWYMSQGLPVTLGAHCLPFVLGAWRAKNKVLLLLLVWKVFVLSLLAHKEFRFLMPVLPLAMHYCGVFFHSVTHSALSFRSKTWSTTEKTSVSSRVLKENPGQAHMDLVDANCLSRGSEDKNSLQILSTPSQGEPADQASRKTEPGHNVKVDGMECTLKDGVAENRSKSDSAEKDQKLGSKGVPHVCCNPMMSVEREDRTISAGKAGKIRLLVFLLATSNLLPLLYFSLIHQRGTIDVMNYLHDSIRRVSFKQSAAVSMDILFLMPCHSTPYYSYLHSNVSMRFLTCEPNLSNQDNYTDQAALFYQNPAAWLNKEYLSVGQTLPTHVVYFNSLQSRIADFLLLGGYSQCATFFHTHVPEGRIGSHVMVSCR